ncbi:MAG TPA: sensor histidine kinase, partial [Actinophytocola sp.]|nr:sensor histidine kinase [Actinophytocola sp.]
MAVAADQWLDAEPVRPGRSWWLGRSGTGPEPTLRLARQLAADLRDGLSGARVRSAARGARRLLGVTGVGLADLTGVPVWAGAIPADGVVPPLVQQVLHTESRAGRTPVLALPLHVQDELAGVLVVHGAARRAAVREVADWVVEALERGRLEASAEQAA